MLNDLSLGQERRRLCGEEWIFQQDNAATHNASITKKSLFEQKIRFLDHPACSPDLGTIKYFAVINYCKSLSRMSTVLSSFLSQKCNLRRMGKITSVQLQKLIESMTSQIFEVIKANGGSTKY